jgi:hypothetical protein
MQFFDFFHIGSGLGEFFTIIIYLLVWVLIVFGAVIINWVWIDKWLTNSWVLKNPGHKFDVDNHSNNEWSGTRKLTDEERKYLESEVGKQYLGWLAPLIGTFLTALTVLFYPVAYELGIFSSFETQAAMASVTLILNFLFGLLLIGGMIAGVNENPSLAIANNVYIKNLPQTNLFIVILKLPWLKPRGFLGQRNNTLFLYQWTFPALVFKYT